MNAFHTKILLVMLMVFAGRSNAATKTRCEVVRALRGQGVPDGDLSDWLCLVDKESSYRYDVTNDNSNGSTDYGIYQINDRYWCDDNVGLTNDCNINCNDLLNSDISDDTKCALKIKGRHGFYAWYGWKNKCKGKDLSGYGYSHC